MSRTLEPSPTWFEIDPAFYAHGGTCFSPAELEHLGPVSGATALVGPITPADQGEEALSLANLGASVTAWGTAEAATAPARDLAARAGITLAWHHGDLATLAAARPAAFDRIYATWGSLDRVEDIDAWAAQAAALLAPGGRLVLHERHPAAAMVDLHKGLLVVARSYFGDPTHPVPWTLGELITALAAAGLCILALDEFPASERYQTPIDRLAGLRWEQRWRVPAAIVLSAARPAPPVAAASTATLP